jgi:hypothetical protein
LPSLLAAAASLAVVLHLCSASTAARTPAAYSDTTATFANTTDEQLPKLTATACKLRLRGGAPTIEGRVFGKSGDIFKSPEKLLELCAALGPQAKVGMTGATPQSTHNCLMSLLQSDQMAEVFIGNDYTRTVGLDDALRHFTVYEGGWGHALGAKRDRVR